MHLSLCKHKKTQAYDTTYSLAYSIAIYCDILDCNPAIVIEMIQLNHGRHRLYPLLFIWLLASQHITQHCAHLPWCPGSPGWPGGPGSPWYPLSASVTWPSICKHYHRGYVVTTWRNSCNQLLLSILEILLSKKQRILEVRCIRVNSHLQVDQGDLYFPFHPKY